MLKFRERFMMRPRSLFMHVQFPRTDENGKPEVKMGLIRRDAIEAFEPGTKDGLMHIHLKCGSILIVTGGVTADLETAI